MNRRLLYLVSEDWYFLSHRLPLALAAREAGWRVGVACRDSGRGEAIRAAGLDLFPLPIRRAGLNPLADLVLVKRLTALYRRQRPAIVHQVAMKPVIHGSLAARLAGVPGVVNALAGLGFLFSSNSRKARLLRPLARRGLGLALQGPGRHLIVQNPDDRDLLRAAFGLPEGVVHLIPGSGVDLETFTPRPFPAGPPVVMLASRLLWDKGVGEFVAAARLLRGRGVAARFVLVGAPDPGNPASVPEGQISAWTKEGVVEHWGRREDMPATLARARMVCLPSYREGLPKVLLEAAACGRPVIASDAPGCCDALIPGETGLLVPAGEAAALAERIQTLLGDPVLCGTLGGRARRLAEARFGVERVIRATLALYEELISG